MGEFPNSDSNGEIEPKTEVISDEEHEEPSRKRARATVSTEGSFDKLVAEAVEKALREKKIEESIPNIHKATLEISDSTVKEVSQLNEKIQMTNAENSELKRKIGQQENLIEKLQKENLQNEIKNQKLKEYILKMKENHENDSKSTDLKISELEGKVLKQEKLIEEHENSTKKLFEEEIQVKMKENQEVALVKMKTENLEWKQKMDENLKANYQQRIIPSDNCKLPMTAGEREYLNKCIFCKSEEHKSMECKKYPTHFDRRQVLFYERNRCLKCLDLLNYPTRHRSPRNHILSQDNHSCPRANVMCSDCCWDTRVASSVQMTLKSVHLFHHPILCKLNEQSEDVKVWVQINNERRHSEGKLVPSFAI